MSEFNYIYNKTGIAQKALKFNWEIENIAENPISCYVWFFIVYFNPKLFVGKYRSHFVVDVEGHVLCIVQCE